MSTANGHKATGDDRLELLITYAETRLPRKEALHRLALLNDALCDPPLDPVDIIIAHGQAVERHAHDTAPLFADDKPEQPAAENPALDGAAFVLDAPDHVPAVWGRGAEVLWSRGEVLLLTGPQGVGKSTIAQQLIRGRLGLTTDLLGFPVVADDRPILLLALDRPSQIARSMRRMFTPADREALGRLRVLRMLPADIVAKPGLLAELVRREQAGTLVIDSLKDVASDLSAGEVGAKLTHAMRGAIDLGCEVAAVHHHRKANAENKKPSTLSDVYGSTWLTSGAGSVVTIWGTPGDIIVELLHLKQPAEEIGPLELEHDHVRGVTTVRQTPDAWTLLVAAALTGTTAIEVATALHAGKPSRPQVEKARRRLERFVAEGFATRVEDATPGEPVIYRPVVENTSVTPRDPSRDPLTQGSREPENPPRTGSRDVTDPPDARPPLREGAERDACVPVETQHQRRLEGLHAWVEKRDVTPDRDVTS